MGPAASDADERILFVGFAAGAFRPFFGLRKLVAIFSDCKHAFNSNMPSPGANPASPGA